MSASFTVFSNTGALIIAPFLTISGVSIAIASYMLKILAAGLTINIIWHGYETMRGKGGQAAFLDVFAMSLRVGLVAGIGLWAYQANVPTLIDQMINQLSALFTASTPINAHLGGESAGISPALVVLDQACQKALDTMSKIWDIANGIAPSGTVSHITFNFMSRTPADFSGVMMIIQGVLMLLAFGIYACLAAFELLYIQIALLIFYAIGPLFVGAYAFKSTEHFFSSWLKGALQYAMTAVLIAIVVGLGNGILDTYATRIQTNLNGMDFILLGVASLLACLMLVLLIKKVPELAGHIIGGIAVSTASSTVAQALNKAAAAQSSRAESAGVEKRHQELMGARGGGDAAGSGGGRGAKPQSAITSGISRGLGAMAYGTGSGVGAAMSGAGAAVAGTGKAIGTVAAAGAQRIASMVRGGGSNSGTNSRPAGASMQSMLNK